MILHTSDTFLDHSYYIAGRLVDPILGEVTYQNTTKPIRRKELEALALLAEQPGKVVSRSQFILEIWNDNHLTGEPGLSRLMSYLRSTLDDKNSKSPIIRTVPRKGYQLNADVEIGHAGHNRELNAGDSIDAFNEKHLVRLLSKNVASESWLVQSNNEYKVYRFCLQEEHRKQLRRELKILSYLNVTFGDHPHICTINQWQLNEPPYYLEMPSTDCGDVEAWMKEYANLTEVTFIQKFEVIKQITEALVFIHDKNIVHQNISRNSVFIHKQSPQKFIAKLGEFGLSRVSTHENKSLINLTESGYTLTSAGFSANNEYLAPEILNGTHQDSKSDIYALGVLTYQILLGSCKFVPVKVTTDEPQRILSYIDQCLSDDSDKRPSADQLLKNLTELSRSLDEKSLNAELATQHLLQKQESKIILSDNIDTYIGPYNIKALLGEGGMGSVYLGHQSEPVDRNVAIKVIKTGLINQNMKSRFNQEVKSLAVLEHPNIAVVYEASVDKNGYPYMVMEYVPGLAITSYCDLNRLSINERIKLFIQVCDGVLHAHQKSIIHRDINPQNILVNIEKVKPEVKLIDFGVAKFQLSKNNHETPHTHIGSFVGIPNYISPEQISGETSKTDTRSDLYSLGVVLYELLIGRTPYTAEELNELAQVDLINLLRLKSPPKITEIFQQLDSEEQTRIAALRKLKPNQIIKSVGGEISWIINKCLEPNINDRYESVLMLKQDLQNYLDQKPVTARKISQWYSFDKFVKRNRMAVLFGTVIALSLVVTTTLAVFGQYKAQKAAEKAQELAVEARLAAKFQSQQLLAVNPNKMGLALRQSIIEELKKSDSNLIESKNLNELMTGVNFTDVAMEQLDDNIFQPALIAIENEYQEYPLLQANLRQSIADTMIKLGLYEQAKTPLLEAYETRLEALGPSNIDTNQSLVQRAKLANFLSDYEQAETLAQLALTNNEKSFGMVSHEILGPLNVLARIATDISQSEVSNRYDVRILSIIEKLKIDAHNFNIKATKRIGIRKIESGQFVEAIESFEQLIEGVSQSDTVDKTELWNIMYTLSIAYFYNRQLEEAENLSKTLLELQTNHYGSGHNVTLKTHDVYSAVLMQRGQLNEALEQYNQLLETATAAYGENSTFVMRVKPNMAYLLVQRGDLVTAKEFYESILNPYIEQFGQYHFRTINILDSLGSIHYNLGENNKAKEYYQLALFEDGIERKFDDPTHYIFLYNYSYYLVGNGLLETALELVSSKLIDQTNLLGDSNEHVADGKLALGWVYQNMKQYDKAAALYKEAEENLNQRGNQNANSLSIYYYRSLMLRELGQYQKALSMSEKLVEKSARFYPDIHFEQAKYLHELATNQLKVGSVNQALTTLESAWGINTETGANGQKYRNKIGQDLIELYGRAEINLSQEEIDKKIKKIEIILQQ